MASIIAANTRTARTLAEHRPANAIAHSPSIRHRRITARAQEVDVQVFRFTLGIPGFDDAYIPRVVGFVGGALLTVNHVLSESPVSAAQVMRPVRDLQHGTRSMRFP